MGGLVRVGLLERFRVADGSLMIERTGRRLFGGFEPFEPFEPFGL